MADEYMTIADYVEQCLSGDLTEERLVVYGNKLYEYEDEYAKGRAYNGSYDSNIEGEIRELIGYLRGGLPKEMKDGSVDFFWEGDVEKSLRSFIETEISPETPSHPNLSDTNGRPKISLFKAL